jgi:hypothetical protein
MLDRPRLFLALRRLPVAATIAVAVLMWMVAVVTCRSQPAPAPPPAAAQPVTPDQAAPQSAPAAPPAAPENPGLINEMGKVLEKSLSILPTLKGTGEALDDFNARAKDAAKDAGESLSRLANPSSLATGRMLCPVSANGASDCKVAADKLCVAKGLKEGKSLTTDSVQVCSPKVMIPGRARKPDDCRTDNYVTRALCQ